MANSVMPAAAPSPSSSQRPLGLTIPPVMNLHYAAPHIGLIAPSAGAHYFAIPENDKQAFFAISRHRHGLLNVLSKDWDLPSVVLHAGPTEEAPALATVDFRAFKYGYSVHVAPLVAGGIVFEMHNDNMMTSFSKWSFDFPAPESGTVERFEWRHSRSAEVASTGSSTGGGYKLVRLSQKAAAGQPASDTDGAAIIAVCGEQAAGVLGMGHKIWQLRFLADGAQGQGGSGLGEVFSAAVVTTCLVIYVHIIRARQAANAANSGAAITL
jgi:hypothetical protein